MTLAMEFHSQSLNGLTIYCSGPLFSPEERATMAAIDRTLTQAGFQTFLPQRDGLEPVFLPFLNSPLNTSLLGLNKIADRSVFRFDVHKLVHHCDAIVMNMNGRVPDEGACVEAGIAFALGKPVILYKEDARSTFNGLDNAMLSGLTPVKPAASIEEIPTRVHEAIAALKESHQGWIYDATKLSPFVLSEAAKGESAEKIIRTITPATK